MHQRLSLLLCICFTIASTGVRSEDTPPQKPIEKQETVETEEQTWAEQTVTRSEHLYPSLWGQVGIFRIRSAESLPQGAITFGIAGEFYSVGAAPAVEAAGLTSADTIAETLFVGYSPIESWSLFLIRRNSSTTYSSPGGTTRLISSLGDFTLGSSYSFELTPSVYLAPLVNFTVASNFNDLAPAGSTVSVGLGTNVTWNLFGATGLPLFLHGNLTYHMPQIRNATPPQIYPETFFQFSRFHSLLYGVGSEIHLGNWIPFVEYTSQVHLSSGLDFFSNPGRFTMGTRVTPLENKALALLAGVDISTGRGVVVGVPYTPPVQIVAQVSYTTGLTSSERKHYVTTRDVEVVNRKFIIKKNIHFKVASHELADKSTSVLDQIAEVILKNNVKKLLIVGHTDSSHTEDYNLKLSLSRAETVKRYLVSRGVDGDSLMTQGYGKRKPIASNATEQGRSTNRRVEFFIVE